MADQPLSIPAWARYLPPTSVDVASQLQALRQDGPVSATRVRDYYTLLHLPPLLHLDAVDTRAELFVTFLRWTLQSLDLDDETQIIARWSLFPPKDLPKIAQRHEQARIEIRETLIPRAGEVIRDYSAKMISDRERAFLASLAHHLVNREQADLFLATRGIAPSVQPPRDPFDGTNLRWHEWRIVLDRRAHPVEQYCYYNVLMEAIRTQTRFFHVNYTSGDKTEPDDPISLISKGRGHVILKPVLDNKPLQRSRHFVDAVYFGRTLSLGDRERVKYRRTLFKDVGEESWAAMRTIAGSPYKLDMRILLDPSEPISKWREEIWTDQSPDAELIHERDHPVRGAPRMVHWPLKAQPDHLHRLVIVP